MGFNIGGKDETKVAPGAGAAQGFLLEALFPGLISSKEPGAPIGLGTGGSQIVKDMANFLRTGGKSLSLAGLEEYNTLFEKYSAGQLDPASTAVFDKAFDTLNNPVGLDMTAINQLSSQIGGGGIQKLPDPPNIGKLTTQIISDLPENFQTFINNIMTDSSPEAIQAELDNLSTALSEQAAADADSLGGQLLGAFASQGVTGGAAIQGMKQLATSLAIRTLDDITKARLAGLDTLIRARDQGINLMGTLLNAGANEQANIVRQRVAELEAQTAIQVAKIQETGASQRALIAAQTQLQVAQLGFTGDIFAALLGESGREELARREAITKPIDILTQLAIGISPTREAGGGFGLNLGDPFSLFQGKFA